MYGFYFCFIGGPHKICVTYRSKLTTATTDSVRFSIRMNVGEEELKNDDVVKTDFISQVHDETSKLREKTNRYIVIQEHNRGNEDSLFEV